MQTNFTFQIFSSCTQFPALWDLVAAKNIFLTTEYLTVLETAAPANMICRFIGIFDDKKLVGVAVAQFLDLSSVASFGERDKKSKITVRRLFFKLFTSRVLLIGNNMLTGQNAFALLPDVSRKSAISCLHAASTALCEEFRARNLKPSLIIFKDFMPEAAVDFEFPEFRRFFQFSTQPNMVLTFQNHWSTFDDYLKDLTKKYRDHYKRARKKSDSVTKRKLSAHEIAHLENDIHRLYTTVAKNAPFNTFYLSRGHFYALKQSLADKFLFYGYFENEKLIGFNTLFINGIDIDTYFLGYAEEHQREKMLYLNMLYDMIGYTLNKGYKKLVLGRTAIEIKSSVGAQPVKMIGYMKHNNPIFNYFLPRLFTYFEPEINWKIRSPFVD